MRQLQERVLSYGVKAWSIDFLNSARGQTRQSLRKD
jgi:hypothetical protein